MGDQEEHIERVWTCDGSDEQTERAVARILDFAAACGDGPDNDGGAPAQPTKRRKLDGDEPCSRAESAADGL